MPATSAAILERFRRDHARMHAGDIDLTLRPAYLGLLQKLGTPQRKLPPIFHVAGTNGKGSVCAFLRAMLEAGGYNVHVYTSPHLVRFHERIRVAGQLIAEDELVEHLAACERVAEPGSITYFEAATAAAFLAFAAHKADFTILEVGLGGRLDATNVIERPLADIITRISFDHRDYLGNTLEGIAREKAGITRKSIPCFSAPQPDEEVRNVLQTAAADLSAPFFLGGKDWHAEKTPRGFHFRDKTRALDLPQPALTGEHQIENAGLAIVALSVLPKTLPADAIKRGLANVEWPARLEQITKGALFDLMPKGWELWLDGGHNDSAGAALARQAEIWRALDGATPTPLHLICGMLTSKNPGEFLSPLAHTADGLWAVGITGADNVPSFSADELANKARAAGITNAHAAANLAEALQTAGAAQTKGRILICGSLYLAGEFLSANL